MAESWRPLRIRANPELELDVDIAAGSLTVEGMHGGVTCDVSGGSGAPPCPRSGQGRRFGRLAQRERPRASAACRARWDR